MALCRLGRKILVGVAVGSIADAATDRLKGYEGHALTADVDNPG